MSAPNSSGFFPLRVRRAAWQAVQPGQYHYHITADALVQALLATFALRLAGLRDIAARFCELLQTRNFSSLSHALTRPNSLQYIQTLIERLQARHCPARDALVIIDGMPLTLPATRRHRCAKFNDQTVGGGVIWCFMVDAARGACPVRVLKVIAGAWNDRTRMRGVRLEPRGPVYVMDRGFYAMELLGDWLSQGVRFVVRAQRNAVYQTLRDLGRPRRYGSGWIELDARVRLGCTSGKLHPEARMIRAVVGEQVLVIVTGEMQWSAERVLDAYKKRERIERFHRILKDVLGLAHLYSFSQSGIMFLLHAALLLAMLLVMSDPRERGEVVWILNTAIQNLRTALGLGGVWRRNTNAVKRAKKWK